MTWKAFLDHEILATSLITIFLEDESLKDLIKFGDVCIAYRSFQMSVDLKHFVLFYYRKFARINGTVP